MSITFPCPATDFTGGRMIITSGYGPRWGSLHAGCDIGTTDGIETGVDLGAVESGEIVFQQPARLGAGAGHYTHLLGDSGTGWRYLHQLETFVLPVGTRVERGQHLGEVGNTGGVAPHLHIEKLPGARGRPISWWFGGNTVDPAPDLRDAMLRGDYMNGVTVPAPPPPPPEKDWLEQIMANENERAQFAQEVAEAAAFLICGAAGIQGAANAPITDLVKVIETVKTGDALDAIGRQLLLQTEVQALQAQGFTVSFDQGAVTVAPKA